MSTENRDLNPDRQCVIIGSRPVPAGMLCYVKKDAFVIAADAGWRRAEELGLAVDLALGDYDSSPLPDHLAEVMRLPAEKDDTDAFFAAKQALARGFSRVLLLGMLGGRADHSLAALATLLHLAQNGAGALLAAEGVEVRCTGPGQVLALPRRPGYLSVFPAAGTAKGVCERGVKYPLFDATLTPGVPLGVSNEFAAEVAEVSCREGWLFVLTVEEWTQP